MWISRNVHIAAPVEAVFSLLTDPETRAALNPAATPLDVEIEDGEPLHEGSICHYRMQIADQIVDYRTRVAVFEPNRRIVSIAEADSPFEIEVQTVPEDGGTRLIQRESFQPTESMLQTVAPKKEDDMTGFIDNVLMWVDDESVLNARRQQEQALEEALEANLQRWLEAIKDYLEKANQPATAH